MADTKITALTAIGANPIIPSTFPIPMVDLTDTSMAASGTTKKVTVNQILGAGGTATLASATITGDLTVDTNVLKVDTTNNRVGINNASPAQALDVAGSVYLSTNATYLYGKTSGGLATRTFGINAANDVYVGSIDQSISNIRFNSGGGDWAVLNSTGLGVGTSSIVNAAAGRGNVTIGGSSSAILNLSIGAVDTGYVIHDGTSIYLVNRIAAGSLIFSTNSSTRYQIASDGVATWSNVGGVAGTAMTLNSTGLGVGDAPAANTRLTLGSVNPTGLNLAFKTTGVTTGRVQTYLGNTSGDLLSGIEGSTAGQTLTGSAAYSGFIGTFTNNPFYLVSNGLIRATIDSSGNVGIGGNASVTGIDTGVARLFVVAPNSNTGMAATFIADSVGRGLLVADQGKTNSFGVEVVAGLVKTGGFTSGTSVALFANAVERARVKSTGQVRFVPLAADPAGAEAGDVYYNSTSNKLKCYNGTTWNDLF